jgi:hypothetical protein
MVSTIIIVTAFIGCGTALFLGGVVAGVGMAGKLIGPILEKVADRAIQKHAERDDSNDPGGWTP